MNFILRKWFWNTEVSFWLTGLLKPEVFLKLSFYQTGSQFHFSHLNPKMNLVWQNLFLKQGNREKCNLLKYEVIIIMIFTPGYVFL